jgi:hypothetical protein
MPRGRRRWKRMRIESVRLRTFCKQSCQFSVHSRSIGPVGYIPLHGIRQLVAPRYSLHNNVLIFDTSSLQRLLRTIKECVDDFGVPSGVDNANA